MFLMGIDSEFRGCLYFSRGFLSMELKVVVFECEKCGGNYVRGSVCVIKSGGPRKM